MLSVQDTAAKFNISARRVQKLCEEQRIPGAQRISGVWLIPENAEKPADRRTVHQDPDMLSLTDVCKILSISTATGRNWIRLGKLLPEKTTGTAPVFSQEYVISLREALQEGQNSALKSRRNKKYVSGNDIYNSYVPDHSPNIAVVESIIHSIRHNEFAVTGTLIRCLLAECALQLITQHNGRPVSPCCLISDAAWKNIVTCHKHLINDLLIPCTGAIRDLIDLHPGLFDFRYTYQKNEDTLGLLYISLLNMQNRKATGSYYTPSSIVNKLCQHLFRNSDHHTATILDPCCGTGNFLLQLPDSTDYRNVFGNDIDELSVELARINYSLKFQTTDLKLITDHITHRDYLTFIPEPNYDIILGNPPWGYAFSEEETEQLCRKYISATQTHAESYDVFTEQALSNLNDGGILSFVLPEALLNVKAHSSIREKILKESSIQYLSYLGNAFYKVQCPCIILQLIRDRSGFHAPGMIVEETGRNYTILQSRPISSECFRFTTTDEEFNVMSKIKTAANVTFLKNQATFALGIVTGNNKKYLSDAPSPQNEPILKGSDIYRFRIRQSGSYIKFLPGSFQQVAPTEYYRAKEKLLYRFICNQLVFAYDSKQTLSLNSCNLLIPRIEGLRMKYIMAVLNSRTAQYYFKKMFNSVKVLRSHIESIPIPVIPLSRQEEIIGQTEQLVCANTKEQLLSLYNELDRNLASLYHLTEKEYEIICSSLQSDTLFLS